VNTIIINHADTFGLAQLYQLRGRVGRSTQQAYAYLLIPGDMVLSTVARKRIEALEEFSELGAGLHLASRDLEIRGAGNLLGAQQSGHIASVGFDLYCQMMAEAVRAVRGEEVLAHVEPELRLPVQGYIPESYIEEDRQRLEWYRRFSTVTDAATLETLRREVRDRFGAIPAPFSRLLMVIDLKIIARQLAIERVEQHGAELLLTFHPQTPVEPARLLRWLHAIAPGFRWQSEHVVRLPWPRVSVPETDLVQLKDRLQQLQDGGSIL
jgi:transcription-repair coupling factor (superfamily II helicase)